MPPRVSPECDLGLQTMGPVADINIRVAAALLEAEQLLSSANAIMFIAAKCFSDAKQKRGLHFTVWHRL